MATPISTTEPIVLFDSSTFVNTNYSAEPLIVSMSEGIIGRALPGVGAISMSDVNKELEKASPYNQQVSLGDANVRTLFKKATGAISMLDGQNKFTIDLLVVGGGGGGGSTQNTYKYGAGGGGGGGVVMVTDIVLTVGDQISITVGAGGSVQIGNEGLNGGNSSAFGYIALGGGGGGGDNDDSGQSRNGENGGSGGGAYPNGTNGASLQSSTYGYGYGNNGGTASTSGSARGGGGGGGASAAGSNGSNNATAVNGAAGGAGIFVPEANATFGGGGGGGGDATGASNSSGGAGGAGGGGNGGGVRSGGFAGTNGLGGGGGGAGGIYSTSSSFLGGVGGTGTVRFRYIGSPRHTTTSNYTVSELNGYTYITCNTAGTFTFTA